MTIQDLVNKYHSQRESYLRVTYNETQLRSEFLDPLFELLGWDIKNKSGKSTHEREVLLEEALKPTASENSKKPDILSGCFLNVNFFLKPIFITPNELDVLDLRQS